MFLILGVWAVLLLLIIAAAFHPECPHCKEDPFHEQ